MSRGALDSLRWALLVVAVVAVTVQASEVDDVAKPSNAACTLSLTGKTDNYVIAAPVRRFPLTQFTTTIWVKTSDTRSAGLVSYATHQSDNHFLIYDLKNVAVFIGQKSIRTGINLTDGKWHHIAVVWTSEGGKLTVYKDGVQAFAQTGFATGHKIEQRGSLVIGQEQDRFGGGFTTHQAFKGEVRDFRMYNVVHDLDWVKTCFESRQYDKRALVIGWPLTDCSKRFAVDKRPGGEIGLIKPRGPGYPRSWSRCHLQLGGNTRSYASVRKVTGFNNGTKVSAMFWMRSGDRRLYGTPFSYHKDNDAFTLYNYQNIRIIVNGQQFVTGVSLTDNRWHHVAVTWNSDNGYLRLYVDGLRRYHTANAQKGWKIPEGGSLVLGNEQDSLHGRFQWHQSFAGRLSDFRLFNGVVGPWGIRRAASGRTVWAKANLLRFKLTTCRSTDEANHGTLKTRLAIRGAIRQRPRCVSFGGWKPRGVVVFSERDRVSKTKTYGLKSNVMLPFGDLILNYAPKTGMYSALRVLTRHKMSYPELVSDYFSPFRSGWKVVGLQGDYVLLYEQRTGRYELYPFSNHGFDKSTAYGTMPPGVRRGWEAIPLTSTKMLLWHRKSGNWRVYTVDRFVHGRERFFKRLVSQGKWCDIQRNEDMIPLGNGRVMVINREMGSYRLFALGNRRTLGLFSTLLARGTLSGPFITSNTRFIGLHGAKLFAYLPKARHSFYTTFDIGYSSRGRSSRIDAIGDNVDRSFKSVKASIRKAIQASVGDADAQAILHPRQARRRSFGGLGPRSFRSLVKKYLKGAVPLKRLRRFARKWRHRDTTPLDLPSDGIGRFAIPKKPEAAPATGGGALIFQDVIDPAEATKIDWTDAANLEKNAKKLPPDTVVVRASGKKESDF